MNWSRRDCLTVFGATVASGLAQVAVQDVTSGAKDEQAWRKIQETFPIDRRVVNLNHAGVGTCPRAVVDAVVDRTWDGEKIAPGTIFSYGPQLEVVRQGLAGLLACDPEEVAITRNATEALNAVLLGLPLKAGDEVLTTTLDYWAMLDALQQRQERDGIVVTKVKIPVPCADLSRIVELFQSRIGPQTKLILISHPINLNAAIPRCRYLPNGSRKGCGGCC